MKKSTLALSNTWRPRRAHRDRHTHTTAIHTHKCTRKARGERLSDYYFPTKAREISNNFFQRGLCSARKRVHSCSGRVSASHYERIGSWFSPSIFADNGIRSLAIRGPRGLQLQMLDLSGRVRRCREDTMWACILSPLPWRVVRYRQ